MVGKENKDNFEKKIVLKSYYDIQLAMHNRKLEI